MQMKRKEYKSPSIHVIEAEVQLPIANSNVNALPVTPWSPAPSGDGTIDDA
jgi:hypothetical protein